MYDKINVMGEFGAEEASDNGRSLLDICKDTCIYMSVFEIITLRIKVYMIHNRCQYECKKFDYVLVQKNILRWMNDVKAVRWLSG